MLRLKSKFIRLSPDQRLYQLAVPVIGLTGGIASGKSTVAKLLGQRGLPIINADHLVKSIYQNPESLAFIQKQCPQAIKEESIHFPTLRKLVFQDPALKALVEDYIYQRLPEAFQKAFQQLKSPQLVVYDVPLLFERQMEHLFDIKVVVYSSRKIQRARLMERDGHAESLAETILNHQMDIEVKKNKADFVIDNSRTETELVQEVEQFLRTIC